ncbi:ComEC/Rec2 family competence protein [Anabaena sp. FACHB-1237]|uniref:ComEC/Rec2 family competence protein n=1 Tax=Anabaena sp. FACHB-1237 TaxID=2692769 RepID=UPI001681AC65|nr:ComEC/Rec2 family competence protein [Anabaena sp. FACHB-1237]MBD2136905.1 ComEC/Rec2 family competence protein [Anabaena sp. FACHB-1237]
MMQTNFVIICLSYILGLLSTAFPWSGLWILLLGIFIAVISPLIYARWRKLAQKGNSNFNLNILSCAPHPRIWIIAGIIGLLATLYFNWRVPVPGEKDISKFVIADSGNLEQVVIVRGFVDSKPRLTRSQKGQFWLNVTQLDEVTNDKGAVSSPKGATGKLYVTVPMLQVTGLYPGEEVAVTGLLYKPTKPINPGGFDFQRYLQQEGCFAGLVGKQMNILDEGKNWGWWQIRDKIVRSQVRFLGVPEGILVSAMVLGNKAVDLPYDIRDIFVNTGLAHALAASGFQTSLILGVILTLTKRSSKKIQIICGTLGLIIFLCLSGFEPAILRAVIMGFAALLGLALGRNIKQLGSLLLAATLLLLFNPLWIWNLGFQLSFLATLGLVVTASAIDKRLDWMPPAIASLISVPLAATMWTTPRLLEFCNSLIIYSLPLNIIATPFISVISLGGMLSSLFSVISPDIGSILASFLYYPTHWLIAIVELFENLPGNIITVGSISNLQMLAIYALIIITWLIKGFQKRWWLSLIIAVALILVPLWYSTNNLFQVTLLATRNEPVLVIQEQGNVTLINSGDEGTGRFTILPFLRQQGINQINNAIASKFPGYSKDAWLEIMDKLPIKNFYEYTPNTDDQLETQIIQQQLQQQKGIYRPLLIGQMITNKSTIIQLIDDQIPIIKLQILDQNWLLVGNTPAAPILELIKSGQLSPVDVLWCTSEALPELVLALKPQIAIAPNSNLENTTLSTLKKSSTKIYFTGKDGAIQWTPNQQFSTFIRNTENKSSVL